MSTPHSQEDNDKISSANSTIFIEKGTPPTTQPSNEEASSPVSPPYSIFTIPQKRWITFLIAFMAWFSTLSSFIYFPALSLIALDLHTSIEGVNLTITSYLVASAIIPSIVAPVADLTGRRPIYMFTFFIYFIANIGLALQDSLVGLILLRVLQSVGISGAFAITYGAIADIAGPAERGSYVGVVALGTNTAPSIGPLLGGIIAANAGWRWIFWFLSIASGLCLFLMVFFLPETARNKVGDGSLRPKAMGRLPFPRVIGSHYGQVVPPPRTEKMRPTAIILSPLKGLYALFRKDTAINVFCISIWYATWTCIQASLSTVFIRVYHVSQLQAGLIYIPFGVGVCTSAYLTGQLLNRDYHCVGKSRGLTAGGTSDEDISAFPIEEARLKSTAYPLLLCGSAVLAYGWTLQKHVHISVPLILQFITGASIQVCFTTLNTLLMDQHPKFPATAQAASNIVRCAFAAIGAAVEQPLIDTIGVGWCFVILAALCVACLPLLSIEKRNGLAWRMKRMEVQHATLP